MKRTGPSSIVCPHCGDTITQKPDEWGGWFVDIETRDVRRNGVPVALTWMEARILATMIRSQGRTTPNWALQSLFEESSACPEKMVDVLFHRMRIKLGEFCHTEFGAGKRLLPAAPGSLFAKGPACQTSLPHD